MKTNELKVGLAVLISLVILIGGIMWGKGFRLQASRYTVQVVFTSVGGLEQGANVMANGVVKGRVRTIEFRDGTILVTASIDKEVRIYSDYFITIESPTVMAGNALSIYTGTKRPEVDISQPLQGDNPMSMSAVAAEVKKFASKIEVTLGHLNELLVNMNTVVGDSTNQENMNRLLAEATESARQTSQLLSENRQKITESLDKLEAILDNTAEITATANDRLGETMDGVDSAMVAIEDLAQELRGFVARLENEDSAVGKLLTDDELYIRLTQTLAEIDSLSVSLRTKGLRHKIVFF
ncbi:MCE family protein [bacterium]|nr:MCE family protein [bacterium]MBU1638641.1 MCE family protein [bacterium]MBU1919586.1 MCE family protein [bacterium]